MRRAYITGIVALGLTLVALRTAPSYTRLVSSTQTFQHYLQDLKGTGKSLSPIERFVFSLILTNTPQSPASQSVETDRRS
jgi:hypothetical protein